MSRRRNWDDPVYKRWRTSVYRRDKFVCQMPGCKSKKQLQAHHIRRWASAASLRFDVGNGITLCRVCHNSISKHEHNYERLFLEIVRRNSNGK